MRFGAPRGVRWRIFRRKPAPDLIRGGHRFADKNMRQTNSKLRAELGHASSRRRRSAEEEGGPRDRPGSGAALGRGTRRSDRLAQGGDRATRQRAREEAGVAGGSGWVLQEVI